MKEKIKALADKYYDCCARIEENEFKKDLYKLREEAVREFVDSIRWKNTKEIDITDDLIDGRSLVKQVEEYLSQLNKEEE